MTRIIRDKFTSPNFDDRNEGLIDMIVIHSTHMPLMESMQRLCDPVAKVSSHYIIDLDGSTYRLVDEKNRAWHAGCSYWRGRSGLNDYSIGIELVDTAPSLPSLRGPRALSAVKGVAGLSNPEPQPYKSLDPATKARGLARDDGGEGYERLHSFTSDQMDSTVSLCSKIIKRYEIQPYNIVAHSDIAPSRKDDPGEGFNWKFLARRGIGVYHDLDLCESGKVAVIEYRESGSTVLNIQKLLSLCGYQIELNGVFDDNMRDVVIAFKRHFYPERVDDVCDANFQRILENIALKAS